MDQNLIFDFTSYKNFKKAIFIKNYIDYIPKNILEKILIFVLSDIYSCKETFLELV